MKVSQFTQTPGKLKLNELPSYMYGRAGFETHLCNIYRLPNGGRFLSAPRYLSWIRKGIKSIEVKEDNFYNTTDISVHQNWIRLVERNKDNWSNELLSNVIRAMSSHVEFLEYQYAVQNWEAIHLL